MQPRPAVMLALLAPLSLACTVNAQDASGMWELVPSPNAGPQPQGNTLYGVAASSPTDAWAVGARPNPSQYLPAPLAMHWDGAHWSLVETPDIPLDGAFGFEKSQLNSVAAVTPSDVWAVGSWDDPSCICGHTIIEHWNGASWSLVQSPNPGIASYLASVAAISATTAWAVGYSWTSQSDWAPLILQYDGVVWSAAPLPNLPSGRLSSVFALAPNDAWAVGWIGLNDAFEGLTLHWDGAAWTRVPFPTEAGGWRLLRGVSGSASNDVWAVGVFQDRNINGQIESRARAFHWNGASWSSILYPGVAGRDSNIQAVHAVSTNDVWAVGAGQVGLDQTYRYVTLHWDGANWSSTDNPNTGVLYGVSASSRSDAWAVGFGFETPGTYTLDYTAPPSGCCRADYDADGDTATDRDIEAFYACMAGNCCNTCPPNADYDCDGDVGTDQDVAAFFRVLAGGSC